MNLFEESVQSRVYLVGYGLEILGIVLKIKIVGVDYEQIAGVGAYPFLITPVEPATRWGTDARRYMRRSGDLTSDIMSL